MRIVGTLSRVVIAAVGLGFAIAAREYFLSGRRDSMCPMLKQPGSCGTSADGSDLRADANGN